ncbi:MAG: MBL fold metallo-hydrolase [Clostridiales bacterium]|nr:MBL fold metallo-hydrolase [Clostridiales bacterium]
MNITMLGTGNAMATECYNTCFVINDNGKYFMVDGGGGNTVIRQLNHAGLNWMDMREIFITHRHSDHLFGILWMVRMICQSMKNGTYKGDAAIYGHDKVISIIRNVSKELLSKKEILFLDNRLHLIPVCDGEVRRINERNVTFFDIQSTKAKQFGFCMELDGGEKLTCCDDEPCSPCCEKYARNSKWLLHEAFCLYAETAIFSPYEKHHSTVKDACERAERLGVQNLLLYHTEDKNIRNRKTLYMEEGKNYFSGNLYVPDDLETIEIG